MTELAPNMAEIARVVEAALRDIVAVRTHDGSSYVSVPLFYPSGSFVTVKIDQMPGCYRVSDNGFAFREIESIGAQRSFGKTIQAIVADANLVSDRRRIYVDVTRDHLVAAICEVASASWQVATKIYSRASDKDLDEGDQCQTPSTPGAGVVTRNLVREPMASGKL
jgi:hypothetical protein